MSRTMKDTGIPWVGSIPQNWKLGRVKQGFFRKKAEAHEENPVVLSLARAGVKVRDISNNEGQLAESYYNYNPVVPGDLLLNPMDLYSGANCSISKVSGVISPAYINLGAKEGFNPSYYDYYFKTQYWAMAMFAHGKGVSFDNRWTLNANDLLNYYIPIPDKCEQDRIATCLDNECKRINNIITKTQESIEEYKKLKQSIITHAVTKGVRGDREMKDSGIEWIGTVPDSWGVVKGHRIITGTQNGLTRRDLSESKGNIVLKLKNIKDDGSLSYDEVNRIELNDQEIIRYKLNDGDFLFVRVNGSKNLVGKCSIFKDMGEIVGFNDHIIRVRFNDLCSKQFLKYYLLSEIGKIEIDIHTNTAAGQYTISGDGLRDLRFIIPPKNEQIEIADYLNEKCEIIDNMIHNKDAIIKELEVYKKSLIYEYITGKKEVV